MLGGFLPALFVSAILGILSGLGTGGGSLLILYLTCIQNMPMDQSRSINLLFFIPSALVACLFRWKQGRLDIKKVLPAILAGSISAAIFAHLSTQWDTQALQKIFGALLVITGIRELFYKPKQK